MLRVHLVAKNFLNFFKSHKDDNSNNNIMKSYIF